MPNMSPVTQLLFAHRLMMELTFLAQYIWLCIFSYYYWEKNICTHTSIHLGRHQGMVSNVIGGTLCIQLDNGRSENVELGKQAIRLIASRSKGGKRWNLFPICSLEPVLTLPIAMIMAGRVLSFEVWHPLKHSGDHLLFMGGNALPLGLLLTGRDTERNIICCAMFR